MRVINRTVQFKADGCLSNNGRLVAGGARKISDPRADVLGGSGKIEHHLQAGVTQQ